MTAADLTRADRAAHAADHHARTCRACCHRIIDDEGNPGYFSEACREGVVLLVAYCDAIGADVPPFYRKYTPGASAPANQRRTP